MKIVHIEGRVWSRPRLGGCYHTATVWVDGERLGKTSPSYGSDSMVLQSALALLKSRGVIDQSEDRPIHMIPGIKYTYSTVDVARERDL